MRIPVGAIGTEGRLRSVVDAERVQQLRESIKEIGLQTPITVARVAGSGRGAGAQPWRLVAGLHRLEAVKALGRSEIEAVEMTDDEVSQKLWECDENLCRAELTDAQRARFTAERKRWYEVRHPRTRHGGDRRSSRQVGNLKTDRFSADVAQRTGRGERSIQRDAYRGDRIDPKALAIVEGTEADKGFVLDQLAKLPLDKQARAARLAVKGKPLELLEAPERLSAEQKQRFADLMTAWRGASVSARAEFLERIELGGGRDDGRGDRHS